VIRERLARRVGADLIAKAYWDGKAESESELEAKLAGWPVRGRVIVNRKTGAGDLRGILWEITDGYLLLRQAELVGAGDPKPIDNEVLIERDEVEFIQILKR
jgi:hypothetical protein